MSRAGRGRRHRRTLILAVRQGGAVPTAFRPLVLVRRCDRLGPTRTRRPPAALGARSPYGQELGRQQSRQVGALLPPHPAPTRQTSSSRAPDCRSSIATEPTVGLARPTTTCLRSARPPKERYGDDPIARALQPSDGSRRRLGRDLSRRTLLDRSSELRPGRHLGAHSLDRAAQGLLVRPTRRGRFPL